MKNNKGFTLVEMLVVVAIIAALSITIGISTNSMSKSTKESQYEAYFDEIFDGALIYVGLNHFSASCKPADGCIGTSRGCDITFACLVEKGVLDQSIYEKYNPMYAEEKNIKFKSTDKVTVMWDSGVKKAYYNCGTTIVSNEVKDYEKWGSC